MKTADKMCIRDRAVSVRMQLLTLEKQRFSLMRAEIGEDGERQETAVQEEITVDLCAVDGTIVTGDIPLEDGGVTVEALSGEYVLRLAEKDAAGLDVLPQSEPFELPGREETVVFESTQTRLMLRSVDENGSAIAGAAYTVTDSNGHSYSVTTDDAGTAVTPLMALGEATIRTQRAPEGYDDAAQVQAQAAAGEAAQMCIRDRVRGTSFCRLHRGRSSCAAAKPRAWKCRPQVPKDALRFKRKAGARYPAALCALFPMQRAKATGLMRWMRTVLRFPTRFRPAIITLNRLNCRMIPVSARSLRMNGKSIRRR